MSWRASWRRSSASTSGSSRSGPKSSTRASRWIPRLRCSACDLQLPARAFARLTLVARDIVRLPCIKELILDWFLITDDMFSVRLAPEVQARSATSWRSLQTVVLRDCKPVSDMKCAGRRVGRSRNYSVFDGGLRSHRRLGDGNHCVDPAKPPSSHSRRAANTWILAMMTRGSWLL